MAVKYRILVVLVIPMLSGVAVGQSITKKPTNATGIIDGTAEFECEVDFGEGIETIQWQFNNDIIYAYEKGQEIFPRGHIKYSVDQNGKRFTLTVSDLELSNGGQYSCRLITDSAAAQLTVLDTPKLSSATPNSKEGDTAQYICEAQFAGSSAADNIPKLQMLFAGNPLSGTVQVKEIQGPKVYYQLTQVHNMTLDVNMHGKNLVCIIRTSDPVINVNATTVTEVSVLYGVRNISYAPKQDQYEVGTVINCAAKGNPAPEFSWKDEKNEEKSVKEQSLKITSEMVGSNIWKCLAWNTINGHRYDENVVAIFDAVIPAGEEAILAESGNDSWKIGVGVGVPVVICLVVIIVVLLYWCKKGKKWAYSPVSKTDLEKDGDVQIQEDTPHEAAESGNMKRLLDDSHGQSSAYEDVMTSQDAAKQDTGKDDILEQNHNKEDYVPKQDIDKDDEMLKKDTGKDDDVPKQNTKEDNISIPDENDNDQEETTCGDSFPQNKNDPNYSEANPPDEVVTALSVPPSMNIVPEQQVAYKSVHEEPESKAPPPTTRRDSYKSYLPWKPEKEDSQDFAPLSIGDQTDGQYPDQQEYPRPVPMPVKENLSGLPQSYTSDNSVPTFDTHSQENYVQEGDRSVQSQTSEPYYTPVRNTSNNNQQKYINKNAEDKPQSPQIQGVQAEPPVSEKNKQVKMTSDDKAKGSLDQAKKTLDEKPKGAPRPLNKALQPRVQDVQEKSTVSSMPKQKPTDGNMKQTAVHQPPQGKVSKPVSQTAVHQDTQGIVPKPATTHQDKNRNSVTIDMCNTQISKEKSFHGLLPREEVQHILQQNGDYLITYQSSEQAGQVQYELSFVWNQKIGHAPITFKGGKWILNDKHEFASASALISSLSIKQWPLVAGSMVSLKNPVARKEWELNADDIILENDIRNGNFGPFVNGKHLKKKVIIHVHDETVVNLSTFVHGGRLLKGYQHQNIANIIGIAITKPPVMMVMEFESEGILQTFLQNHRNKLELTERMKMCENILAAMTYLKERSCIHRNIAAQNCLVGEDKTAKIGNFSMAREGEEYKAEKSEVTPVKWTAPEALREGKYTHLSDVWSFGILMWEIFSFGEIPYEEIPDERLLKRIGQGYRLSCPKGTPTEIYKFMKLCWAEKPMDRPDIVTLASKLKFDAKRLHFSNSSEI